MKIKLIQLLSLICIVALSLFQSCGSDPEPIAPGKDGFYVVNEGAFGNNNASLSFYDRETDQVANDVFQAKNGRVLGDQAQSMTVFGGRGYIVVQNSGKVEVIDINDNSSIKTITESIESPRYFIGVTSTQGYLSDWGADGLSGTVKVIDLQTLSVTKTIAVGHGPNKMILIGDIVHVANSGGFGNDNTVAIINPATDELLGKLVVGDNPNSFQVDNEGGIWVACSGNLVYNQDFSINESASTKGSLRRFNAVGSQPLEVDRLSYSTLSALQISPEGDRLYYTFDGAVYAMDIHATALPTESFINKSFYGLSVDPFNGDIIACVAPNFSSAGKIEVYEKYGQLRSTYTVGIAPNGVAFK
jgi:YVTN family beta-propeller protein